MCKVLDIPRSLVYYKKKTRVYNTKLENAVISIFRESKNNYGSRKIKIELKKQNIIASRRKIRQIMDKYRLVSNYTVKQYKVHKASCNEEKVDNIVNREFDNRSDLEIVVSDLTYVNVAGKWHYICLLINLFNREIVGYSAGPKKDAELVYEAFKIQRSLSKKGCPYDNAVAEAVYKIIKTEFAFNIQSIIMLWVILYIV